MTQRLTDKGLKRGLGERQVGLMAIGSSIGVGLFYGAGSAMKAAGPSLLLAYILGGIFVLFIMRALGEMAIHNPVAGSFSRYAYDYIDPRLGFLTGWTYWFMLIVSMMAEITAVSVYMKFWFPGTPPWIWSLGALLLMGAINLISVRAFGELEFWFASIKVVTIIVLIASGCGLIVFGFGNGGVPTGISNLWRHGGFFPKGTEGWLSALPMVVYAYMGTEMIGLTAGEATNPEKTFKRAVDSVFWRISFFYVGALFVIMSAYPWDQIGTQGSPFVLIFDRLGLRYAAGIVNFVILTAALSSCNSNIFGAGRILYNLACQAQAPARCKVLSRFGVPVYAIIAAIVAMFIGVVLNFIAPQGLFILLSAIAAFAGLFTWAIIVVAHLRFRQRVDREKVVRMMPFAPYSSYATLAFIAGVALLLLRSDETRLAMVVGPIWLAVLWVAQPVVSKRNGRMGRIPTSD